MTNLLFLVALGGGALVALRARFATREARSRRTFTVQYPRGSTPDQVLAFTRSLSGLLPPRWQRLIGSPAIVIETQADSTGIRHYLRLPAGQADYVLAQVRAAVPGVRIEEADAEPFRASLARALRVSSRTHALRADDPAQAATALLATLAPLQDGEQVMVQWVVAPAPPQSAPDIVALKDRSRGWLGLLSRAEPVRLPTEFLRSQREKQSEPPLHAVLRIGVRAYGAEREQQVLRRVLGAFHLGTTPQATFRVRALPPALVASHITRASVPLLGWPCLLSAGELAAFAGLPIGTPRLPGLTLGASPQLPPAAEIPAEGRVLGRATFPGAERPVAIAPDDNSFRNLHLIGPTGSGKTSLALNLICGDLAAGHGVVVLDPKGDLVAQTLERIPRARLRDVTLVDPCDTERPVGVNLLAGASDAPELVADQVVSLFRGLYPAFWGPRTDDILRAALLTLTRRPGMTLAEVPLILTDEGFRHRLTGDLDDYVLEGFWGWYESLTPGERAQAVGPVLNKIRTFLVRKRLRNVIGQSESTFSLSDVLARQKVLLVNLAKGTLGEDASRLLGSAILAQLWQAVQARAALPEHERPAVFGFVDEFQDYVGIPTSFADLLAQTRSYRFGLALAHQHFGQLPGELKQAVLANARSRVAFQLGHADAATLAKEFGPDVTPDDLGALAAFEAVAQVSAGSQVSRPVTVKTLPPPPATAQAETVRALSRQRYGRPVNEVEAALRARAGQTPKAPIKRTRRAA